MTLSSYETKALIRLYLPNQNVKVRFTKDFECNFILHTKTIVYNRNIVKDSDIVHLATIFNLKESELNIFTLLHEIGHAQEILYNKKNVGIIDTFYLTYEMQVKQITNDDLSYRDMFFGYALYVDWERSANQFALCKLDEAWSYIMRLRSKLKNIKEKNNEKI